MNLDPAKAGGALLGTDIAQLICAVLQYFWHIPITGTVEASITGICVFLVSHFLPSKVTP